MTYEAMSGPMFERLVRRSARARWDLDLGEGGPDFVDGREIDCVCETDDVIHLVEATTSRKADKVRKDSKKLSTLTPIVSRKRDKLVQPWIITRSEPTADQRSACRGTGVKIQSLDQFRRSILDVSSYIRLRSLYQFGSASDPATTSTQLPKDEYIALPITTHETADEEHSITSLARRLEQKQVIVLLGEFGAGKSLSIRELFYKLSQRHHTAATGLVPVPINLREHWGQIDLSEILHRHANQLGFDRPQHLVRAWHAGQVLPLLDGFDELFAQGLVRPEGRRRARRAAVQVVREAIRLSRRRNGVIVAGRAHYFDSIIELRRALGLRTDDLIVDLGAFGPEQADEYLRKRGVDARVPEWIPRRPLLLGHLAARKLLHDSVTRPFTSAAAAWNGLLDDIVRREAQLSPDLEPYALRRLLEKLATSTRTAVGGQNELTDEEVGRAYKEVTGYPADGPTHVLLQRLPGLTVASPAEGTRTFVADEMREALQASDLVSYIAAPHERFCAEALQEPLSDFACSMVGHVCETRAMPIKKHVVAAQEAVNRWDDGTLALDAILGGGGRGDVQGLDCEDMTVREGSADVIDLESYPLTRIRLHGCIINHLRRGSSTGEDIVLKECLIGRLEGVSSADGVPNWMQESDIVEYERATTTADILKMDIPLPVRVALTVLKKTFVQAGRARLESALPRGLDARGREYLKDVIEALAAEGIIRKEVRRGKVLWCASASERGRVRAILGSPLGCGDRLIDRLMIME